MKTWNEKNKLVNFLPRFTCSSMVLGLGIFEDVLFGCYWTSKPYTDIATCDTKKFLRDQLYIHNRNRGIIQTSLGNRYVASQTTFKMSSLITEDSTQYPQSGVDRVEHHNDVSAARYN